MNNDGLNVLLNLMALATFTNPMAHKEHIQMNWELEKERALFEAALKNAIAWQNKCVELYEIIEMLCLDAEAELKENT